MDRLSQADAVLAAAARRDADVLLPGRVTSPMDCCVTLPVAREIIDDCDARVAREVASTAASAPGAGDAAGGSRSLPDPARDPSEPVPVVDEEMRRLSAGAASDQAVRHSA